MTRGWTKMEHSIWEIDLTLEERYMLLYLIDCENKFNKEDNWFGQTDDDFINIGFGKNKQVLRKTRNALIEKNLIFFKRGKVGSKSEYKINRNK
jgi:hypothetical protein